MSFLAIMAGLILALQGPVNSSVGQRTSVWQGTAVSFTGGMLTLIILVALIGQGDLSLIKDAAPWQLLGGLYGIISVAVTIAVIPKLGAALSLMAIMLGQLVVGAVVDGFGWLGVEPQDITPLRVIGMIIIAVGIVLIYLAGSRNSEASKESVLNKLLWLIIAFLSGGCMALQSPTNASLASIIGRWEGTLISFTVGAAGALLIVLFVFIFKRDRIKSFKGAGIKPWMVTGGLFGVVGIFLNLLTVTAVGAALQAACGMVGQLLGGVVIDSTGICGSPKVKINGMRISGIIVISAGVVVTTIASM